MNQNKNLTVKIDRLVSKKDSSVKAYASATIANSFAIHGIKVIDSSKGLFVQMPQSSYKQKDGQVQYNDIFHAITADAIIRCFVFDITFPSFVYIISFYRYSLLSCHHQICGYVLQIRPV